MGQKKLLVHCTVHQIREGFEATLRGLGVAVEVRYADLARGGLMSSLSLRPDLIVLLQSECDEDYLLPVKMRLFAAECPLLVLAPAMPERYFHFLKAMGVEHVVELPAADDTLREKIAAILEK